MFEKLIYLTQQYIVNREMIDFMWNLSFFLEDNFYIFYHIEFSSPFISYN